MMKAKVCLKCRKEFKPIHSGNFICPKCHKSNAKLMPGLPRTRIPVERRGGVKSDV